MMHRINLVDLQNMKDKTTISSSGMMISQTKQITRMITQKRETMVEDRSQSIKGKLTSILETH